MHTPTNCIKCFTPTAAELPDAPDGRGISLETGAEPSPVHRKPSEKTGCAKHLFDSRLLERSTAILNAAIADFDEKLSPSLLRTLCSYVPWVYAHSINVAIISLMIAIKDGDAELSEVGVGAFLHDIGKLMVSKAILEKRGSLDEHETLSMRQHCILGINIIKDFGLPETSTTVILQHHERMDGSGYPYGLDGAHIHRNSQIVMVADVFDALTTHRPYRPAYDKDTALSIMKKEAKRFPADVFGTLEALLR